MDPWTDCPHIGATPKLTTSQKTGLVTILAKEADSRGYPTDRLTLTRVAEGSHKGYGGHTTLSGVWGVSRA